MSPEAARTGPSPKVRNLSTQMKDVGQRARAAARVIARAETGQKNAALFALAELLRAEKKALLGAHGKDMKAGAEALNSNLAIGKCIDRAMKDSGLPSDAVQVLDTPDRRAVGEMLTMPEYVDVVIPRGGKGLVEYVTEHARVPVIKHLHGICH